jgi:hypothetical protein
MATQETHQVGDRKEAPLVIVGSSDLVQQQPREQIYTPEDIEYRSYSELLSYFLGKLTRWKEVLAAHGYKRSERGITIRVFRSNNGLTIKPDSSIEIDDPPDEILEMTKVIDLGIPELNAYREEFFIYPRQAGKHILNDPEDGKPLNEVNIMVHMQDDLYEDDALPCKWVSIETERSGESLEVRNNYREAIYGIQGDTIRVKHQERGCRVMTDEMAIGLFNTIDSLIPQVNSQLPEPTAPGEQ